MSRIEELGYQIIAVSPDRPEGLRKSIEKHRLSYRLLSDSKMTAAAAFGVAYVLDEKRLAEYKGYGIDLEEASGDVQEGPGQTLFNCAVKEVVSSAFWINLCSWDGR